MSATCHMPDTMRCLYACRLGHKPSSGVTKLTRPARVQSARRPDLPFRVYQYTFSRPARGTSSFWTIWHYTTVKTTDSTGCPSGPCRLGLPHQRTTVRSDIMILFPGSQARALEHRECDEACRHIFWPASLPTPHPAMHFSRHPRPAGRDVSQEGERSPAAIIEASSQLEVWDGYIPVK